MFARSVLHRESDCYDGPFAAEYLARVEPEIALENSSSMSYPEKKENKGKNKVIYLEK